MTAYMIRYHEVDRRGLIVWDYALCQEQATDQNEALERAQDFLTWDEDRDLAIEESHDGLCVFGSIDDERDLVAVVYRKDI